MRTKKKAVHAGKIVSLGGERYRLELVKRPKVTALGRTKPKATKRTARRVRR